MGKPIVNHSIEHLDKLQKYALDNGLPNNIYTSFEVYAKFMVPHWGRDKLPWEWFHFEITDHMQELIEGSLDYLSIETHSQLGKSVLVALFITYVFGLNPDKNIMYFTYNETAATKFTKDYIFGFMGDAKYRKIFPFVVLKNELDKGSHDAKSAMQKKRATLKDNEFNVINPLLQVNESYQGKYVAFGLGQGSHGRPADIMIVDDYVAKAEDVRSETFREKLETSFDSDIVLRFQATTIFMIICTRWYDRDPIGILMDKLPQVFAGFEQAGLIPPVYKSIKIRTEYRKSDINSSRDPRTEDGQYLWMPMLSKYLLAKGGKYYNALFNCDPSDVDVQCQIKKEDFGYYSPDDLPKYGGRIFLCMDGASTVNKRSDHTAIGKWLVFGKKRYLLKIWYVKLEIPRLIELALHIAKTEDYYKFLIEFANSGVAVCQYLKDNNMKHTALGFNGKELTDNKNIVKSKKDINSKSNSKYDRYLRCIPEFQHIDKRILLPVEPIEYQNKLIKQMIEFTGEDGKEDDLVDMTTYLINYTSQNIITLSGSYTTNNLPNQGIMKYNLPNAKYLRQ